MKVNTLFTSFHCFEKKNLYYKSECSVVCHTKCAGLVPHFCGMSIEKANLMLSEMKAANNRRRTFHSDSLNLFSSDNHQNPLFASTSSHTQQQLLHKPYFQENSVISLQSSLSTPVSPKLNPAAVRPLSFCQDTSSFQSLSHIFSQATINETITRANAPLVNHQIYIYSNIKIDFSLSYHNRQRLFK